MQLEPFFQLCSLCARVCRSLERGSRPFLLELQISWPLLVQEWQYIDVVDVVDVVDIDIGIDIASDGRLY